MSCGYWAIYESIFTGLDNIKQGHNMTQATQLRRSDRISKTDSHVETMVDGEIVLMDIEDGKFFSLSGTGRRIWELIEASVPVSGIIAKLVAEYDVNEDECAQQIASLVDDLLSRGLVTVARG